MGSVGKNLNSEERPNLLAVGICGAKNRLFELVQRAVVGKESEINRDGQVVARLLRAVCHDAVVQARGLAIRIRRGWEGLELGDGIKIAALTSEGRR